MLVCICVTCHEILKGIFSASIVFFWDNDVQFTVYIHKKLDKQYGFLSEYLSKWSGAVCQLGHTAKQDDEFVFTDIPKTIFIFIVHLKVI